MPALPSSPLHGSVRAQPWPRGSASHITSPAVGKASSSDDGDDTAASDTCDDHDQIHVATASHENLVCSSPDLNDNDDIDAHPEKHFLSPVHMYEYEDWASEDSEDDETTEVEWDAGITDFSLFDDDRRHARELGTTLPQRWDELVSNQASALQRSEQRTRRNWETGLASPPRSPRGPTPRQSEDIPDLTPDNSPELHDDLDEADQPPSCHRNNPSIPSRIILTPPRWEDHQRRDQSPDDDTHSPHEPELDDEQLLFGLHTAHGRSPNPVIRSRTRLQRPGLRQSRTLSGQAHVWRWPSVYITPVSEDRDGEVRAERDEAGS